jgi:putative ABC transport system permease protein
MSGLRRSLVLGSPRELGTVGLVSGLCGAYAAVLIMTSVFLVTVADEAGGGVAAVLGVVATVFVGIAVYVGAIVMVNAVDTVLAGRLSQIALLRLLGARGRSLRGAVVRGTTLTGVVGALVGTTIGTITADVFRVVLVARGALPDVAYPFASTLLVLPVVTMTPACVVAGWVGSRRILRVTPAAALSGSSVTPVLRRRTSVVRATLAGLMIAGGSGLLALAGLLGEDGGTPAGFIVAFAGSVVAGTGLLVGARFVIPWLVGMVSRLLGTGPVARVAGRNAVLDPLRTTRSTMGLVVGVTLVTTFSSGLRALQQSVGSWDLSPADQVQMHRLLSTTTAVMIAIVVISAVISAVGFVSTMSLTVIQRRREIGLLRTLGLTRRQVRRMITLEAAALSGTAVAFGIALGVVFGSFGAQSLVGSMTDGFVWGLPWRILGTIAAAGLGLVLASARPPARRAIRISPIEALRVPAT